MKSLKSLLFTLLALSLVATSCFSGRNACEDEERKIEELRVLLAEVNLEKENLQATIVAKDTVIAAQIEVIKATEDGESAVNQYQTQLSQLAGNFARQQQLLDKVQRELDECRGSDGDGPIRSAKKDTTKKK